MCDERGQAVVVAEADLIGGDGVVLVDDRHDAEGEQAFKGRLRVAVVRPPDHVVGGEQDLPDGAAVPGEGGRVGLHQQRLADRSRGLLGGEVAGPPGQAERGEPGRDGTRRDKHQLGPGRQGVDQR